MKVFQWHFQEMLTMGQGQGSLIVKQSTTLSNPVLLLPVYIQVSGALTCSLAPLTHSNPLVHLHVWCLTILSSVCPSPPFLPSRSSAEGSSQVWAWSSSRVLWSVKGSFSCHCCFLMFRPWFLAKLLEITLIVIDTVQIKLNPTEFPLSCVPGFK